MIIHCPWYCSVHVFVVIHLCDNMWSFWVEANRVGIFLYRFFIYTLSLDIQLSRGKDWYPINRCNTHHICMAVPSNDMDFQHHISLFHFCVQWVKVRGDSSFCWYWNSWPSLFSLDFIFIILKYQGLKVCINILEIVDEILFLSTNYMCYERKDPTYISRFKQTF